MQELKGSDILYYAIFVADFEYAVRESKDDWTLEFFNPDSIHSYSKKI